MIKRYDVDQYWCEDHGDWHLKEEEIAEGKWVKYEDMLELLAEAFSAGFAYSEAQEYGDEAINFDQWKKANLEAAR